MTAVDALRAKNAHIETAAVSANRTADSIKLIAVSKTYGVDAILPVLQGGHRMFGENRVQEAKGKWPALREQFPDLHLALIGPLQSNKAAEAVALFDAIHSIDREKIARTIAAEMSRQDRVLELFVQVNTGEEPQKAGVLPPDTDSLIAAIRALGLPLRGLMCIPPETQDPAPHFRLLADLATRNGLSGLSMGMSGDFETAVALGATHVRVGSAIFGTRLAIASGAADPA